MVSEFKAKGERIVSGVLEEVPSFRRDAMATYYYLDTDKIEILFKKIHTVLEPSVLIEMLAGAIIDISQAQSLKPKVDNDG